MTRRLDNHAQILPRYLDATGERLVGKYYSDSGGYSGPWFDRIGRTVPGIDNPKEFTWDDISAVSMLSVDIPALAAIRIVDADSLVLKPLLSAIPTTVDIFSPQAYRAMSPGSPAVNLWSKLVAIKPGVGNVTAHKLLARKRPHLLPVYDRVVKATLQPVHKDFWIPMFESMKDEEIKDRLQQIHNSLRLGPEVSLLRVLDVAVWMRSRPTPAVARR